MNARKLNPPETLALIVRRIQLRKANLVEGMHPHGYLFQLEKSRASLRVSTPTVAGVAEVDDVGTAASESLAKQLRQDFRGITQRDLQIEILGLCSTSAATQNRKIIHDYKDYLKERVSPTIVIFPLDHIQWLGSPRRIGRVVIGRIGDAFEQVVRALGEELGVIRPFSFDADDQDRFTESLFLDRYEKSLQPFSFEDWLDSNRSTFERLGLTEADVVKSWATHTSREGDLDDSSETNEPLFFVAMVAVVVDACGDLAIAYARRHVQGVLGAAWLSFPDKRSGFSGPPEILELRYHDVDGVEVDDRPVESTVEMTSSQRPYIVHDSVKYYGDPGHIFREPFWMENAIDSPRGHLLKSVADAAGVKPVSKGRRTVSDRLISASRHALLAEESFDASDRLAHLVIGLECLVPVRRGEPVVEAFVKFISWLLKDLAADRLDFPRDIYDARSRELHEGLTPVDVGLLYQMCAEARNLLEKACLRMSELLDGGILTDAELRKAAEE